MTQYWPHTCFLKCLHPGLVLWHSIPYLVLAALILTQLPANAPGKAEAGGPSAGIPATHVGDQDGVPYSWLHWLTPG